MLPKIFLYSTDAMLIAAFIISIQQLCTTNAVQNAQKQRLRRTILVSFVILIFLAENSLVYLSAMYPKYIVCYAMNMVTFQVFFEIFVVLIAYHTFRLMLIFLIKSVYDSTSIRSPKWFNYLINILQTIIMMSAMILYSLYFITKHYKYVHLFYAILMFVIVIIAIFIIILLQKPLRILKEVQNSNINHQEVARAALYLKVAVFVTTCCIIMAILDLCINIQNFGDVVNLRWNFSLINILMHSVIVIVLTICLIVWIYKTNLCCKIPRDSVCEIWCCFMFAEYPENRCNIDQILLQDSDCTSINTNNKMGKDTILYDSSANTKIGAQLSVKTKISVKTV
eukprot:499296_1